MSVIVPVYKVEKYLDRCIRSLLNQTLPDIEIILVDDGSPDKCPEMCDLYAQQYDFIKVIHKKNGGLSSARNAGIEIAQGKYIGFVDSDDEVEPEMYEKLYKAAVENDADYVMADYVRVKADGAKYQYTKPIEGGYYSKEKMKQIIYPSLIMGENLDYGVCLSVWLAVFKTNFLNENCIRFDEEVRWSEDNIFSAIVGYQCMSMYYLKNEYLYHYHENPGTITTSYKMGAWDVYCKMNEHLRAFFEDKDGGYWKRQFKFHTLYYALVCLKQEKQLNSGITDEYRRIIESKELAEAFRDLKIPSVPFKMKILLCMIKHKLYFLLGML